MLGSKTKNSKTNISVIIPVYNDSKGLLTTIKSLINQKYPKRSYEIIIIDNNSTDNTPKLIEKFKKRYPKLIIGLSEKKIQSSYAARNKGIRRSNGKVLIFIDANMWVDNNWLTKIDNLFKSNEALYIGFNVEIIIKKKTIAAIYNKITGFPNEKYSKKYHFFPTNSLAVSKKIFDKVGLFYPSLISGGDNEFGNRVYQNGFSLKYAKNIKVYHPARYSFFSLISKWFRLGKGLHQLNKISKNTNTDCKKSPFSFINALIPPRIEDFKEKIENDIELSLRLKIIFYFIEWLQKIVKCTGYMYDRLIRIK